VKGLTGGVGGDVGAVALLMVSCVCCGACLGAGGWGDNKALCHAGMRLHWGGGMRECLAPRSTRLPVAGVRGECLAPRSTRLPVACVHGDDRLRTGGAPSLCVARTTCSCVVVVRCKVRLRKGPFPFLDPPAVSARYYGIG